MTPHYHFNPSGMKYPNYKFLIYSYKHISEIGLKIMYYSIDIILIHLLPWISPLTTTQYIVMPTFGTLLPLIDWVSRFNSFLVNY